MSASARCWSAGEDPLSQHTPALPQRTSSGARRKTVSAPCEPGRIARKRTIVPWRRPTAPSLLAIAIAWIRSREPARTNRGRHSRALAIALTTGAEHSDECFATGPELRAVSSTRALRRECDHPPAGWRAFFFDNEGPWVWRGGGKAVDGFASCFCLAAASARRSQWLLDGCERRHDERAASTTMQQAATPNVTRTDEVRRLSPL